MPSPLIYTSGATSPSTPSFARYNKHILYGCDSLFERVFLARHLIKRIGYECVAESLVPSSLFNIQLNPMIDFIS